VISIFKIGRSFICSVADLLFPEHCLLCGKGFWPGEPRRARVCTGCTGRFTSLAGRRCNACGQPLVSEAVSCPRCRTRRFAFDQHRSLFEYSGDARELVYYFKFKGRTRLGRYFAARMTQLLEGIEKAGLVVPVPSRGRSRAKRGFAPVELLARQIARNTGIAYSACLVRKEGVSQKSLDYEERLANLAGQITMRPHAARLDGLVVLLIDDIFTTGATVHECATSLKEAGARAVSVMTIAMEM
jgi:competence protein ComFC